MSQATRSTPPHAHASQRRRRAQERLAPDRRPAQRAAEALQQALEALGLPDTRVAASAGRLWSQQKRRGQSVGVRFPALCGCRTSSAWGRVRGWDKTWPSRLLRAWPTRSWLQRRRRLGREV
jgi:hypothetical protein